MKTLNRAFTLTILITVATLLLSSCRKKEPEPEPEPTPQDTEQTTAMDNTIAESIANDLESIGSQAVENGTLTTFRMAGSISGVLSIAPCATLTIANAVITVDFGTTGCLGADGRFRKGKLRYDHSAAPTLRYRNPGYKVTVTSENYIVDGYQVNIIGKTITNTTPASIPTGTNPGTNLTWSVSANISIIKPSNAGTIAWTCNRTKELVNTNDTNCYHGQAVPITWTKAVVKFNGTAGGTNAKGESYSATATDLVCDLQCAPDPNRPHRHPFKSGTVNYIPANRPARLINYGNGACDLDATITINGNVYNIKLP